MTMDVIQKQRSIQDAELHAKSMLIVEDDKRLLHCLTRAMEARDFEVMTAETVSNAVVQINLRAPEYAVVDLRLDDGCGLDVVAALKERQSDARAVILTGYGNVATAVKAIQLGAVDYLTKPADVDDIISILLAPTGIRTEAPAHPMSAAHVRWQHIRQVHESWVTTCRKLPAALTCTGAHCSGFCREARRPGRRSKVSKRIVAR